jgi:hypothetical protein
VGTSTYTHTVNPDVSEFIYGFVFMKHMLLKTSYKASPPCTGIDTTMGCFAWILLIDVKSTNHIQKETSGGDLLGPASLAAMQAS